MKCCLNDYCCKNMQKGIPDTKNPRLRQASGAKKFSNMLKCKFYEVIERCPSYSDYIDSGGVYAHLESILKNAGAQQPCF